MKYPHVGNGSSKRRTIFALASHTILAIAPPRAQLRTKRVNYPHPAGVPTPPSHYLYATAIGGYQLFNPLTALVIMPIQMREGQREWICGQIARVFKIYNFVRS
jgi:hypothetical protein